MSQNGCQMLYLELPIWNLFSLPNLFCIQTRSADKIFIFLSTSIVFQPDSGLEFWYLLKITTDLPEPTIMKEIYCELGK